MRFGLVKKDTVPRLLHIIPGLGQGGAERQLSNLSGYGLKLFDTAIYCLRLPGPTGAAIAEHDIPVFSGGARSAFSLGWLPDLKRAIKSWRPDLIVGWMYHGNVAASVAEALGYRGRIVWNIRHSAHDLAFEKRGTRAVIRLGAWLSWNPAMIIYNSERAARQHEALGYRGNSRAVIPNGFDVNRFRPDLEARRKLRRSLKIGERELLLGVVGRYHPIKNHVGWVRAVAHLVKTNTNFRCLMVGTGIDDPSGPVARAIDDHGVRKFVHLFPATNAPEELYPAMDLLVLPSFGEAFPNVVGEAMACGVPAAVTDVGDASTLVGTSGFVIKGYEPQDLAAGALHAISLGPKKLSVLGQEARIRIERYYSLEGIADRYYSVLSEVLNG